MVGPPSVLVIIIEFFGPLLLVVGLATRITSFTLIILMTGIILTSHSTYFFMNWFGMQKNEGFEFFLLAIGMAGSLVFSGAGYLSIDRRLGKQSHVPSNAPNTVI